MSHTTTSIRIIIAITVAASMVVAGISLSSLQQQRGYVASEQSRSKVPYETYVMILISESLQANIWIRKISVLEMTNVTTLT
jgi:hypothetical protein